MLPVPESNILSEASNPLAMAVLVAAAVTHDADHTRSKERRQVGV